jgi:hypothetical protein
VSGIADLAPGTYVITVRVGDGHPSDPRAGSVSFTIEVAPGDARPTYTGALFVSTSSQTSSTATVTLAATIRDISAVDPASDPNAGDIRNASVTFVNRDTGAVIAANVPLNLVTAGDTRVATALYQWAVDIGSADSADYRIGIVVNNY